MINMEELLTDNGVEIVYNHHSRAGWLQVDCVFHNDSSGHLGYNIYNEYFTCYNCGGHGLHETLSRLLNISTREVTELLKLYSSRDTYEQILTTANDYLQKPLGVGALNDAHRKYLEGRNYDVDELIEKYKLGGLDGFCGRYANRIYIPTLYKGEEVSYTTRSIIADETKRYINCSKASEKIAMKTLLYNEDRCFFDSVIVFEGCTSVWRFGDNTVALMGSVFTDEQVSKLSKYKNVFVAFDSCEKESVKKGKQLAYKLSMLGCNTEYIDIEQEDPAVLSYEEANKIKQELLGEWICGSWQ